MNKILKVLVLLAYTGGFLCSPVCAGNQFPKWFYECNGAIGISDMYLDKEQAVKQAVSRALFMQALSEGLEIASVYELYYHMETGNINSVDDQKSHCIAEFSTELLDYDYEIVDVFYTDYAEAVVLLNVTHGNDDGDQKDAGFNGAYMFYYDGTIRYPEYGDILQIEMFTSEEDVKSLNWRSVTEDNYATVTSETDSVSVRILEKYYRYDEGGKTDKFAIYQNTRHGLWHCFTDTFMQALSNFKPRNNIVSSTNRMISEYQTHNNSADYKDKVQDMVRIAYKTNVSCSIGGLSMRDGNLYINWVVDELNQNYSFMTNEGLSYSYESEGYQAVVGSDHSKAKNEARRIAFVSAENEIAKMAKFNLNNAAVDFSIMDEANYYERYCDTTQISTLLIIKDVEGVETSELEFNNGVYRSRIKAKVINSNIIPIRRKQ